MANGKITLGKQSGGTLGLVFPDGVSNTEVVLPESGNIASVDTVVRDNAIAIYDGTTGKLQDSKVTIGDKGNIGIDVTPSDWYNGVRAIDVGDSSAFYGYNGSSAQGYGISSNIYRGNTGNFIYKNTNKATLMESYNGNTLWFAAPSGVVGTDATLTAIMTLSYEGSLLLTSRTGALGYGQGAGGTVTQLTNKSTAVTLNKPNGQIILSNSALAAGGVVVFQVNNSLVSPADIILLSLGGVVYLGNYNIWSTFGSIGAFNICVKNISGSTLSEQPVINFTVIKGSAI